MYKLKEKPEDFIVNEVISVPLVEKGEFSYYVLKKTDYATPIVIEKISKFLRVPMKRIGFAGTKDRRAITTQWISIEGAKGRIDEFKEKDIELEFKGYGNKKIYLGMLEGNNFEIVVRNTTKKPKSIKEFVNYFDEQRFSMNNVEIGRAIVKKDFKKAVEILMQSNGYYEKTLKDNYEKTHDAVNCLRKIPLHVLEFFTHAYQSEIWNKTAEEISKNIKENIDVPIVGFGTEFDNKEIEEITNRIFKEEGITQRDFIIKSFPELSSEGNSRKLYSEVRDLQIGELEDDELNPGMKKITLKFFLKKGNYATMAIKNMFN